MSDYISKCTSFHSLSMEAFRPRHMRGLFVRKHGIACCCRDPALRHLHDPDGLPNKDHSLLTSGSFAFRIGGRAARSAAPNESIAARACDLRKKMGMLLCIEARNPSSSSRSGTRRAEPRRKGDDYRMRPANAAFTAGGALKAPSTTTDSIVAIASVGLTSAAMLAKPRTWMASFSLAANAASRSCLEKCCRPSTSDRRVTVSLMACWWTTNWFRIAVRIRSVRFE